jgi:hypothetical protein
MLCIISFCGISDDHYFKIDIAAVHENEGIWISTLFCFHMVSHDKVMRFIKLLHNRHNYYTLKNKSLKRNNINYVKYSILALTMGIFPWEAAFCLAEQ